MILFFLFLLIPTLPGFDFSSRFHRDVTILDRDAEGGINQPGGIVTLGADYVFVTDTKQGRIKKLDGFGNRIALLETDPPLNVPLGIAIGSSSRIAVVDGSNHQVRFLDPDGNPLGGFGEKGNLSGQLYFPKEILWDEDSRSYFVSDFGNLRIQQFGPEGQFLNQWIYQNPKSAQFGAPRGLALSKEWLVAVYPGFNRVVYFSRTRLQEPAFVVENSAFSGIRYAASDAEGHFYITDANRQSIHVLNSKGEWLDEINLPRLLNRKEVEPDAIHIDKVGNLFVADLKTAQVIRIPASEIYSRFRKATMDYSEGRYDEALAGFERILKDNPNHFEAVRSTVKTLEILSARFMQDKDWEQAGRTVRAILRIQPSSKLAIARLRVIRWEENKDWITHLVVGTSLLMFFCVLISYWVFPGEEEEEQNPEADESQNQS
ncbi:MAG: hypothetical protein H3C47_05255 [Candidatus Cloacimonetes bacterium]|nr:hypothetical protein [Candidatus Cloacimonadota bacterium]